MKNKSPAELVLYCFGAAVLLAAVCFRLRLLHLPIDRDEGEYAYAGWRMCHGGIPFLDYYNMKMPGTYAAYALLFLVFGSTIEAIRWGLIIVNLANTFFVFRLASLWYSKRTGIYAAICYLVFSLQVELQGTCSHAEHFAMLFVLAGMIALTKAVEKKSLSLVFICGILLGIAFLMKQPAASFFLMGGLLLITGFAKIQAGSKYFLRSLLTLAAGISIPLLIITIVLFAAGAGNNFLLFAFSYAREYISYLTLKDGWNTCIDVLSMAIRPGILLWLLVPVSFLSILFLKKTKGSANSFFFFIFSFLAVSAGFYFRPHYFQFLLPSVSIIAAAGLTSWENFWNQDTRRWSKLQFISLSYLVLAVSVFVYNERSLFALQKDEEIVRRIYGHDLFNATKKAGEFIATNSSADDRIAIFGAEPEICFYAKRLAASGFMYVYPFLEKQKYALTMRGKFYEEVLKSHAEILIYISNGGTWYANPGIHQEMFDWYKNYRDSSFKRIALIDIPVKEPAIYHWSDDTTIHPVNEDNYIEICRRK